MQLYKKENSLSMRGVQLNKLKNFTYILSFSLNWRKKGKR